MSYDSVDYILERFAFCESGLQFQFCEWGFMARGMPIVNLVRIARALDCDSNGPTFCLTCPDLNRWDSISMFNTILEKRIGTNQRRQGTGDRDSHEPH